MYEQNNVLTLVLHEVMWSGSTTLGTPIASELSIIIPALFLRSSSDSGVRAHLELSI